MIAFENVLTEWFDTAALRLPDYRVGRVSYDKGRSYVKLVDGEMAMPFRLYTSLTTAINSCAPMERPLLEWYVRLGLSEADRQLTLSQHYGTLFHLLAGSYLKVGFVQLDSIEQEIETYTSLKNYWQPECAEWKIKLKYDILAFIKFCQDCNVEPLGIEYVLLSEKYGFGTLIDIVCMMDIEEKGFWGEVYKSGENKDKPKETKRTRRIRTIINMKSGRHGFYRTNGIQMVAEKLLWEENFPDLPLEGCYNFSPKEWTAFPDYNMKNWAEEIQLEEVESVMNLARVRFAEKAMNKKYMSISGTFHKGNDIAACLNSKTVEQYCMEKFTSVPL